MEEAVAAPEEATAGSPGDDLPERLSQPLPGLSIGGNPDLPEIGDLLATVARFEASAAKGFAELLGEFRNKLAYDQTKQLQVDRLHAELQGYRDDRAAKPVRDVLLGVVRLHDGLSKTTTVLVAKPAEELLHDRMLRAFADFQDDIEMLLGQHSVERFEEEGETFDPRRQMVARSVPTEDPAQVGRIAEHVRPGFAQGETLLQKERVAVYVAAHNLHPKEQGDIS